jgi:hypothetical protein
LSKQGHYRYRYNHTVDNERASQETDFESSLDGW